jgi:hypothetical protein
MSPTEERALDFVERAAANLASRQHDVPSLPAMKAATSSGCDIITARLLRISYVFACARLAIVRCSVGGTNAAVLDDECCVMTNGR